MVIYSYPPSNMVEGNLHNKELKIMGKLEQYAKRLKQNAAKAAAYIGELEKAGFTVSPSVKEVVEQSLNAPDRITQKTYKKAMISLNKNRIKSTTRLNMTEFHDPYDPNTIIKTDKESLVLSKLTSDINRRMRKAGGDQILEGDILRAILSVKGIIKPGADNEYFSISPNYNPKTDYLQDVITFKKLPLATLKQLLRSTRLSQAGEEAYAEDWHGRAYQTLLDRLKQEDDRFANISQDTIGKLKQAMNSSQAWNIAKKGAKDSEQVLENWTKIYTATEQATKNDNDALDDILTMIENESSMNEIISYVDDIIGG